MVSLMHAASAFVTLMYAASALVTLMQELMPTLDVVCLGHDRPPLTSPLKMQCIRTGLHLAALEGKGNGVSLVVELSNKQICLSELFDSHFCG